MKDQLELLSKQVDEGADEGMNATAVSDLAEDLRDAILDYHVSTGIINVHRVTRSHHAQFSQQKAIYNQNCTLIVSPRSNVSRKNQMLINLCRTQVRRVSTTERQRLRVRQPNRWC